MCIRERDTPGHQDFSEDTYRTLMAAASAVMVIDASKGVEAQTRKLFKAVSYTHLAGIIEVSLRRGKKVAVPRIVGRRRMEFFFIKSRADLRPGAWNIPEPGPWCAKAPLPDEETLVILPGAAFDRSGARIGYGGGFYDAYLAGNDRCRKAALAFDTQCMEQIPVDEYDVRAEMIITEKELIKCSQDYPETR